MKSGILNFLEPSGPLQACNGTAFTFIGRKLEAAVYSEAVCTRQHGVISQKRVHSTISLETICNLNIHSHENISAHPLFSMPVVVMESAIRDFFMQNRV